MSESLHLSFCFWTSFHIFHLLSILRLFCPAPRSLFICSRLYISLWGFSLQFCGFFPGFCFSGFLPSLWLFLPSPSHGELFSPPHVTTTRLSLITSFYAISHPSSSCYLKCLFLIPSFLLTIPPFTLDCRARYRSVVSTSLFDHTSTSSTRNAAWLQMLNNIWWIDASLLFSLLLNLICHSKRKLLLFKIVLLIFLTFKNL